MKSGEDSDWLLEAKVGGWDQIINGSFFIWEFVTFCDSLVLWVASNQLVGWSIKTCASISSLKPMMKHSLQKVSDMPLVWIGSYSKADMKYSIVPNCLSLVSCPK